MGHSLSLSNCWFIGSGGGGGAAPNKSNKLNPELILPRISFEPDRTQSIHEMCYPHITIKSNSLIH